MEWLAELLGQTAEQQLRGETSKFDPSKNTIERSAVERFFDDRFGRTKELQDLARKRQVKELEQSETARNLRRLGKAVDAESTMTEDDLVPALRDAQEKERDRISDKAYDNAYNRPGAIEDRNRTERMETRMLNQDAENTRRWDAQQLESIDARRDQTALGMAQLDLSRQQEANRMAEETRRYDQRRADSKQERIAAIIAGLANLGGVFI